MTSLEELTAEYNTLKLKASDATSKLASKATFKGMDSINEIVADAMQQVQQFTANGTKSSTTASIKNKALAIIDPNNTWAGKWLSDASEAVAKETLKEKTMTEIADSVISSINKQREDVIAYMEFVVEVRTSLEENYHHYKELLKKAQELEPTLGKDTRELLDTRLMIGRFQKSILQTDSMITTKINPLITATHLAINEIDSQLPDIEHDLKYEGSIKVAQQALSDLIGMAKTVKSMTEQAGDAIREDVQRTTLESIKMVGDVMIDTERFQKIQEQESAYLLKVRSALDSTKERINTNFDAMNRISLQYIEDKANSTSTLLTPPTGE